MALRTDLLILFVAAVAAALLFSKRVRESPSWIATVTPLASIIGSGFLVVVPLLGREEGAWAPASMLGIVLVAYAIGAVIRHNIRHVEPRLAAEHPPVWLVAGERLADVALVTGYLISVTFYLRILAAFLLQGLGTNGTFRERLVTSAILVGIGVVGRLRGLRGLERLEELSVTAKLAVIAALLSGLALYDVDGALARLIELPTGPRLGPWEQMRVLGGMLLVVQGFETSRYLGADYSAETRIATMRRAQWIAGSVYVVFVFLALPLIPDLPSKIDETAIIDLSGHVATVLPSMLIFAAVMSQFSAAVADTIGAGGLVPDVSRGRVTQRWAYVGIVIAALVLNWTAQIFEIIALASRAFALYYLLQCALAFGVTRSPLRRVGIAMLGALLLFVVLFAVAAG
ncbi:MAG: hypothetical protein R3F16_13480 [Myxococcota bacterium]